MTEKKKEIEDLFFQSGRHSGIENIRRTNRFLGMPFQDIREALIGTNFNISMQACLPA